jgi:hypothetical protein
MPALQKEDRSRDYFEFDEIKHDEIKQMILDIFKNEEMKKQKIKIYLSDLLFGIEKITMKYASRFYC